jgi:outer membrane biosynthesis protein TonB
MRTRHFLILSVLFFCCFEFCILAQGQQSSSGLPRKVIHMTDPIYPELAKRINLDGTVKVLAVVAPDGSVKKIEPIAGSLLLINAAADAISKWKYAPSSYESRESVELHFKR